MCVPQKGEGKPGERSWTHGLAVREKQEISSPPPPPPPES